MSMQLALTDPCVSYLMKTGETNSDRLSKTHTLGSCPAAGTHRSLCTLPHETDETN